MNIRVLKRRLVYFTKSMAFFSKSARMTLPQKFRNYKWNQIKHLCNNYKLNICKAVFFCKIGKCGFLPF